MSTPEKSRSFVRKHKKSVKRNLKRKTKNSGPKSFPTWANFSFVNFLEPIFEFQTEQKFQKK